ncbi:MAG: hypothetical protein U9R03_04070 [Candidatus Aerophobetes bacterium]|nr:hypothetical protein [Candidatus Aerophobetes bacterium]
MEIVGSQTLPSREIIWWLAESYPEEAVLGGAASALGFKEILSDFFFLQSIQYFGSRMESKEKKYKMIYPLLKAMGKLSPHFVPGYSFGALIMEETGHIDVAINLLDEGIENNPYAFELWIYRDFMIRLFKTHEYSKAIQGIKKAIKLEGHPPILERILAYAYEKNGQIKEAILQWRNVYFKEEDPHIKQTAYTHIERLLKILAEKT